MAGHSQFKNIMHRKGAQDAKRAKLFTKLIRELTVASKAGADPEANPRLRAAILAARASNMPKDTMERAIKRGSGGEEGADYHEVRYEGYGPGGVALIIEGLTDNRNRTASEVRAALHKYGGNLGETNSVSFMFDHVGMIRYGALGAADQEVLMDLAITGGAEDVDLEEGAVQIIVPLTAFHALREELIPRFGDPEYAQWVWAPRVQTPVAPDLLPTLYKLVDALEDNDDVQHVWMNLSDT